MNATFDKVTVKKQVFQIIRSFLELDHLLKDQSIFNGLRFDGKGFEASGNLVVGQEQGKGLIELKYQLFEGLCKNLYFYELPFTKDLDTFTIKVLNGLCKIRVVLDSTNENFKIRLS